MSEATERVLALLPDPSATQELADLLADLEEAERKALARPVRAAVTARGYAFDGDANLSLAVLGCYGGARQAASALDDVHVPAGTEPLAVRVLAAREPAWLAELPAAVLQRRGLPEFHVRLVRALVSAGLAPTPTFPEYAEALVRGIRRGWGPTAPTILEELREHPGVLDEVWLVLGTERVGRILQFSDTFVSTRQPGFGSGATEARPDHTWHHALTTLAAEGVLDRDRLIDATLAAFLADWAAADLTWYVGLHDALAPTIDEVEKRQATYARLLTVSFGPAVTLGLRALGGLLDARRLDVDLLLDSAAAPLARPEKGTAWATLTLLGSLAKEHPEAGERIAEVVATALDHPRGDVRERAQGMLTDLRPDGAPPAVAEEPMAAVPREPWRPESVEPASSADEVAELLARLIEEADDPVAVERALDGVLRWAGHRPRTADALGARAAELLAEAFPGPWSGEDLRADLAGTALVWLGLRTPGSGFRDRAARLAAILGDAPTAPAAPLGPGSSLAELLSRRIHEVCVALHGGGGVLLSLPTATDGSLDASTLSRRVAALPATRGPLPVDAAIALLRVPPKQYGDLSVPRLHRAGRSLTAQLEALGRYRPRWSLVLDVEREVHRRQGKPWERPSPHPPLTWRDDAPLPEGLDGALAAALDRSRPMDTFGPEVEDGEYTYGSRFAQVAACWPLLIPHRPDLLAVWAHPRLHRALTRNRSGTEPLLDALGRSRGVVGPPRYAALLLGLAARNGVEVAHADDAVLDLTSRGAVDGAVLGELLAASLRAEAVVGSRVATGLAEVFRADPSTGAVLVDCLTVALPAIEGRRDAHLYVDLLADAAIASGRTVRLPESFVEAARSKAKTQLARACRRVPQPAEAAT